MTFSTETWQEKSAEQFKKFKHWLKKGDAPYLAYGTAAGLSLWPLVEAAASTPSAEALPFSLILALGSVAGGVGGNLIAEQLQRWKDQADPPDEDDVIRWVQAQAAQEPQIRQALDDILEKVNALPQALAGLIDADRAWFAHTLHAELEALGNLPRFAAALTLSVDSGAIAMGDQAVAVGERGVVAHDVKGPVVTGDRNIIQITQVVAEDFWKGQPVPQQDLRPATALYLRQLIQRFRFLNFKGMGVSDRIPLQLPLDGMYVPLKARIEMPEGETWARQLKLAGRQVSEDEMEAMGSQVSEPQPLLELLQKNSGLIVLGDPGAGKTTFLKYLALQLALGKGEAFRLGQRLPVLLPLSAYALALAQKDVPLHRFISNYYNDLGSDLPMGAMLDEALQQGRALFLMDGLDEVRNLATRHLVVERVTTFFTFQQQQGNKFILTSRIVGYRDVRPAIDGLAECTVVDFDDAEIQAFVGKWTQALEKAAQGVSDASRLDAEREREELLKALQQNPGVRRLAANPLLLTILALMKRQGVTLPERRVELYEQYVRTLLKHWNLARGLDGRSALDLDIVETVRVLAPLALWMHETSPGVGLVKREAMRRQLEAIYKKRGESEPARAARRLLRDARDHAGLLVERGQGMYGFIHLTFQEYLTAVAIAQKGQSDLQPVVDVLAARIGDDNWHEVTLLAIGYMGIVQQRDEAAGEVLGRLMAQAPGAAGEAVVLAGEAVADTWPGGVTHQCRENTIAALLSTLGDDRAVAPVRRAQAGNVLARVGDPRPEVMTIDGMQFCHVPAGAFWMGSEDGQDDEKPMGLVDIPYDYWMGRYPVTQAQYAVFVAEGGYKEGAFWPEAAELGYWENGRFKGRYESDFRDGPLELGEPFNVPNYPVVGVTWYESLAFTRWLTGHWRATGILPETWDVRPASEAEWEKAGRGGLETVARPAIVTARELAAGQPVKLVKNKNPQRRFPWENDLTITPIKAGRVNYEDTKIGATSALGAFPGDESPYGLLEMAGNVNEWLRNKYEAYPYRLDTREQPDASDKARSIRGGSYGDDEKWLRCAYRYGYGPYLRDDFIGFRVVVSAFFTSDL